MSESADFLLLRSINSSISGFMERALLLEFGGVDNDLTELYNSIDALLIYLVITIGEIRKSSLLGCENTTPRLRKTIT